MNIIAIKTKRVEIDLQVRIEEWIDKSLLRNNISLDEGDIIVITSKIVSYFERQVIKLSEVDVKAEARKIAKRINASDQLIQLAIDEADEIVAETAWVLLTRKNGIFCANSGVDTSNVPKGCAVLWPKNPFISAKDIRSSLMKRSKIKKLAVLITDSVCTPGRIGTSAITIGYSGLKGYEDLKRSKDLFSNTLRYSTLNIVDSLATSANLTMGEGGESIPMAIIRAYDWKQVEKTKNDEMIISPSDEMFPIK